MWFGVPVTATAAVFLDRLDRLRAAGAGRVPMREIFAPAKELMDLPPAEIEFLLDSPSTTRAWARSP